MITISVVSHGQLNLVKNLFEDLDTIYQEDFEVLLTLNIPECTHDLGVYKFPITIVKNNNPLGFGENHNNAFSQSASEFFAVVNPDIRFRQLNLVGLKEVFSSNSSVGICAPLVINSMGEIEDSARVFPTFWSLFLRIFFRNRNLPYKFGISAIQVDWVAGMFMLFKRESFGVVNGFDQNRYYMYYEDVDICYRLRKLGLTTYVNPEICVIHDAQRASHRSLKHLRWHVTSMLRYFLVI
jgi:GT2 family glycosyltransferase